MTESHFSFRDGLKVSFVFVSIFFSCDRDAAVCAVELGRCWNGTLLKDIERVNCQPGRFAIGENPTKFGSIERHWFDSGTMAATPREKLN